MTKPMTAPLRHAPHQRLLFWLIILLGVVLISFWLHMMRQGHQGGEPHPQLPVTLAYAIHKDMPVYLNGLGSVTPLSTITVRTQINGILLKVLFREGQMVKARDVLAVVDPRPYQAQLLQYQGQLVRDNALLANAKIDLARYQTLWKQNAIAQQTLATQQSLVQQYVGAVQIDQGLIDATKLNLIYCNITAPVSGRVGLRLIDPGNEVQIADANGIAVITSLNPITVVFSIPEDNIPEVLARMQETKQFAVDAYNRDQTALLATGVLITIDNQVDPTTGMVRLRAQFTNAENKLFPNQFVNVRLLVNTLKQAVVIPTAAIQYGNNGSYVYVYHPAKHTVSVATIKTSVTAGTETVVTAGLAASQAVVVQGADNLTDGALVKVIAPFTSGRQPA